MGSVLKSCAISIAPAGLQETGVVADVSRVSMYFCDEDERLGGRIGLETLAGLPVYRI